jgi:HKD family nuclease
MRLLLHPQSKGELHRHYRRAFRNAVELFIVTAYLTDWDESLKLSRNCRRFRVIIGRDFGITRKAACEAVMRWLPPERKGQFMVADQIGGFHPKAVFWKEASGKCFAIVGSSNLTRAAFATNYEANIFCEISADDYRDGKKWVKQIEAQSLIVAEAWLVP